MKNTNVADYSYKDFKISQKIVNANSSDWTCENVQRHGEGSLDFHLQITLNSTGKALARIDMINKHSLGSKEICRLIYEVYLKEKYKENEVVFEIKHKYTEKYISVEMAK